MTMLWLGGQKFNAISEGNGVTASPSADALFPTTGAYDSHPERIVKFGSLTAAPTLTADLDMLQGGGDFESGNLTVDGWTAATTGSGTADLTITIVYEGNYALELDAGTGVSSVYRDIVVRAGGHYSLAIALRGDGVLGRASLVCRNKNTGKYLSGGAWAAGLNEVVNGPTTAAYTYYDHASDPNLMTFQVESAEACGGPLTTLRFQINNDGGSTIAYADAFSLIPGVTFSSVHGHNIDPVSAPTLRASVDNFAVDNDLIATPTLRKPSFYSTFALVYYRYWRLAFADTNYTPIYVGEWVLGEHSSFRGPALPLQVNHADQQVRVGHRFGAPSVYGMGQSHLTAVPMTVRCESTTERDAFFLQWQLCQGGYPAVVVPHDGDGHTNCVYGLISDAMPESWATKTFVTMSTEIEPLPLPLIIG